MPALKTCIKVTLHRLNRYSPKYIYIYAKNNSKKRGHELNLKESRREEVYMRQL